MITKNTLFVLATTMMVVFTGCSKFGFGARGGNNKTAIVAENACFQGLSEENVSFIKNEDGTLALELKWEPVLTDLNASYEVYGDAKFSQVLAKTKKTMWAKKNPLPGETYIFAVRAVSTECDDKNNRFVVYEVPVERPEFAGLSRAAVVSDTKIWLDWSPSPSAKISKYKIYYSKDLSNPIGSTTENGFSAEGLQAGVKYCFIARAEDIWKMQDTNSVEKCATTLTYEVPNFSGLSYVEQLAGQNGLTKLRLVWDKAGGNVTGYRIYKGLQSKAEDFTTPVAAIGSITSPNIDGSYIAGARTTSAIVDGLTKDTAYYFVVRAFYLDGTEIKSEFNYIEKTQKTLASIPPPIAPEIISVTPAAGSVNGNTSITILGKNFQDLAVIKLGGVECTNATTVSSTKLTCVTGAHADAFVDLEVKNPDDGFGKKVRAYEYTSRPSPSVTSIFKNSGPFSGGHLVTISGSNFVNKPVVLIGEKECGQVVFVSASEVKCTTSSNSPGSYDVTVTNPDGQIGSLANGYSYTAAPKITSITPPSGPKTGGTSVTIVGSGFATGVTISFGGNLCLSPSVNPTTIICQSPAANADGPVNVTVKNLDDQTATVISGFTYVPKPKVDSILPTSGNTLGGTEVTIKGGGFIVPPVVFFGGSQCLDVDRKDSATIVCKTPPKSLPGSVNISVQNPDGQTSDPLVNGYTYRDMPTITQISPAAGPTTGTSQVTVIGSGFLSGATLKFGTAPCLVTALSPTIITCNLANKPEGKVDVVVTNLDMQTGTKLKGYYFTDQVAPTVTSLYPLAGSYSGGTNVTVTGTDFVGPATVSIGGSECTNAVVVNQTTITCTTSNHAAGLVSVVVTNNDLQTGTKNSAFTYTGNLTPTITLIDPAVGPVTGGTAIQISGTGFVNTPNMPEIKFGNNPCTSLAFSSAELLTCTLPAGALGSVNVYFTNGDGQVLTLPNGFTYQNGPTVSAVTPNKGPIAGNQQITITGTNFLGGATVKFGNSTCTNPIVDSGTQIRCTTPAGALGSSVTVKVTNNPSGQFGTLANAFTYRGGPKVIGVFPSYGATPNQSYSIAILGSNIDSTTTVKVGGLPCTSIQIPAPYNKITCDTPALPEGDADIILTNADQQTEAVNKGFHFGLPSYKQPTASSTLLSGALDPKGRKDGINNEARFVSPFDIAGDANFLYVSDYENHNLRKINRVTGQVSVLAGTAGTGGCLANAAGGTPFSNVKFYNPRSVLLIARDLFVANWSCNQIVKLNLDTETASVFTASIQSPAGLATDGTNLYFTSMYQMGLFKKALNSLDINTPTYADVVAGVVGNAGSDDSSGTFPKGRLLYPDSIAYANGAIYLSMYQNHTIRKFDLSTNILSTVIGGKGTGAYGCVQDNGTNALLQNPTGIFIDNNIMYLGSAGAPDIRRVDLSTMQVTQYLGTCATGRRDGTVGSSPTPTVGNIRGFFKDGNDMFVADHSNSVVRKITTSGSTVAITTPYGIESTSDTLIDGQGKDARYSAMGGHVALLGDYYYAADYNHHLIRKIHKVTGETTTFSGKADVAGNTNGDISVATYFNPIAVATDGVHLYVSEYLTSLIRKIDMRTNMTSNFAGGTNRGYLDSANGSIALFQLPHDMVSDGANLYMADRYNHAIRKINLATRAVSTLAGKGTACVTLPCDGPVSTALFKDPVAVTTDGTYVYVGELSHVIRRVRISDGYVDTVAGGFNQAGYTNANSTSARFYYPHAITTDGVSLFVADYWNHLVREVNIETSDVSLFLGQHNALYDEDGPIASARIIQPRFITLLEGALVYGRTALHVLR